MSGLIFQAAAEVSVGERDGTVTATFLRTGDLSRPVNVTYNISTETATPGQDFSGTSGTVLIPAGADRATVDIAILNDTVSEATETFVVSIVTVDSGTMSVPRTLRINILDDENPVFPPIEPPLTSNFQVDMQRLFQGLDQPMTFEFSPLDPTVAFVAEKGGLIRTINVQTGQDLGVFIDLKREVNESEDRGLMDIAVHPDFANNPYLYAFYVVDPPDIGALDVTANRYAYVVRYTADASAGYLRAVPGSGVVIAGQAGQSAADISGNGLLDFSDPVFSGSISSEKYVNPSHSVPVVGGFKQNYIRVDSMTHAGGALTFGPDGMLYVSTGDGASPNYPDPHTGDVQSLDSLAGKILRIDPITGQGRADNPFYTSGMSLDTNRSKVYQYGLRNPFSIGFDPTGRLFITDTGWNSYEEINFGAPGANFGWPWYEGGLGGQLVQTNGYRDLPAAAAFYQGVANGSIQVTPPYAAFAHAADQPGYSNQAITGGSVIYSGGRYPTELNGDYFFTDFPFGRIYSIDTNDRQAIQYITQTDGLFAPVHFVQGPDGYVYFVELGTRFGSNADGSIGRMLIFPKNSPSVSIADATVTEGAATAGVVFTLSAAQASDVTITYSTQGGTATAPADFTSVASGTVVIRAGQTSATAQLQIADDSVYEGFEYFTVVPQSAILNGQPISIAGTARVSILDNEVPPPNTNLLVNGSLEQAAVAVGQYGAFPSITGWTAIAGGTIELWNAHNGIVASSGVNFAELDFGGAFDGFYQDVQTAAGTSYTLSLDARLRPFTPASTNGVDVLWNGSLVSSLTPTGDWSTFNLTVAGTGGLDRLTIREVTGQSGDGLGALLDNFRLVAAGPPTPNQPPVLAAPLADQSVVEDAAFSLTIPAGTFSDPNGDPLTLTAAGLPGGVTLTGSPAAGYVIAGTIATPGASTVTLTASDGRGGTATDTFVLTATQAPPGSANLLVNGSLEQAAVAVGQYGAFPSITGWTAIAGGTIELWNAHNGIVASSGVNFAELDFGGAFDGFYQDVQTAAGTSYTLSLDARLRPFTPASTNGVDVLWNGSLVSSLTPTGDWSTFNLTVAGTGGLDRLTIREVTGQSGDGLGALLDNFRLVAAGPPTPNQPPVLAAPLADQSVVEDAAFSLTIPAGTFSDPNGDPLTLTAAGLPGGVTLTGSPAAGYVIAGTIATPGASTVTLTASDGRGGTATDTFVLTATQAPPGSANLLVNGSLEQAAVAVGQYGAFPSITGWTAIAGGTIELWNAHNGIVASSGVNFAELDFGGAFDGFYQDVQTAAGTSYTLSLDARLRPFTPASTNGVDVLWNGSLVSSLTPTGDWSTFNLTVAGTGGLDRLTIREVTGQSGDGLGALLDNFRLVAAGPPTPNQPPVLAAPLADQSVVEDAAFSLTIPAGTFSDPNGDPLTLTAAGLPGGVTLTGSPAAGYVIAGTIATPGASTVTLTASDGRGGTATDTFVLTATQAPPGSANLLVNGSLEQAAVAVGQYAFFTSITGWTAIAGGTIELWNAHNGIVASSGVNFAELDFGGAFDGFYQDVQTAAGTSYTLSLDARLRPFTPASTNGVDVLWNGSLVSSLTPTGDWSTFNLTVAGTGGLDRLTIREVTGQSGDGLGALLDNFRLVAAGPPTPNQPPVLAAPLADQSVVEDAAFSLTIPAGTFSDPNGDPLTLTAAGLPGGVTLTGSPAAGYVIAGTIATPGASTVTLTASDGRGGTATDTFVLTATQAPPGSTNLLVNGSLEQAAVAVGQYGAFPSITGWTAIAGGTIELWNAHNGIVASSGVNFAELDFGGAFDGFYQDVQTAAGTSYTLSLDARLRPFTPASTNGVDVLWNGSLVSSLTPTGDWSTFNLTVAGTGGLDRLTIREVTGQSGDGLGALLDNFRLVAPASI